MVNLISLCAATLIALASTAAAAAGSKAPAVETYTLPAFSLSQFGDPPFSDAELALAQRHGLKFLDRPSIGSGLARAGDHEFWGITDRGPNGIPAGNPETARRTFPLPRFCPTIVRLKLADGQIHLTKLLLLRDSHGKPLSGLSNLPGEERLYESTDGKSPLPLDENGVDPEGIRVLPDGKFLISEEYSPSILVVNTNGEVLVRYTPVSKRLPAAGYPVKPILPAVFAQRRINKGFENLALSPDGRVAYAILQSPMGDEHDPQFTRSRMLRAVALDFSDPLNAKVTGEYLATVTAARAYASGQKQDKISWSDAESAGPGELLVIERGKGEGKLLLVDFRRATNLLGRKDEGSLIFENVKTDLASLGVRPAVSREIFSTRQSPAIDSDKLEGLAIVGPDEIALSNDNDFGIGENPNGEPSRVWLIHLDALRKLVR